MNGKSSFQKWIACGAGYSFPVQSNKQTVSVACAPTCAKVSVDFDQGQWALTSVRLIFQ
ncbi:hypothetical protein [Bacteroides cellulosilyticus]|uniref:hypothetical protein n=1 Tax=Bacteroides cellulosilyticus TaxID=246787 RepID=UPI002F9629BD